ncbi:MAG: CDP-glycerol glycerophosphotransferase family protein [Oscillospiraceae bacterium]|nr:CDP-glycerol glycerophosphotransferase family protein [Oscillospiraceae bacterium]
MLQYVKSAVRYTLSFLHVRRDKVVFLNFAGKGYGDNPKYICQTLLERRVGLRLIWLTDDPAGSFPPGVTPVKYRSLRSYWELATARVWVDNARIDKGIRKKPSQFYIQTWHASFSLKKIEMDAQDKLPAHYVADAKRDGAITDLLISNSAFQTEEFRRCFWYGGEILECGYPRNDVLIRHKDDAAFRQQIRETLGVASEKYLVLYAPTFRDNNDIRPFMIDFERFRKSCAAAVNRDAVLLIRLHPNIEKWAAEITYSPQIINASHYPDMQELLLAADLLVTDYSTSIFDFAILGKPVILYASDIAQYDAARGLKPIFYRLPFPLAETEDTLNEVVFSGIGRKQEAVEEFMGAYGSFDEGHAGEIIAQRIEELTGKGGVR